MHSDVVVSDGIGIDEGEFLIAWAFRFRDPLV
jgi:hypothetical protein